MLPERGNNTLVDESFPRPGYVVHCRSLAGVRRPTLFDELPYLGSKTELFGGRGFDRPPPIDDLNDDGTIRHIWERDLAGEDFHSNHRERKNVCGFGYRYVFGTGFAGWADELWGEPPRGSCNPRCRSDFEGRI